MIRTPHYRTPLSPKQQNIFAFKRLIQLAKQKSYCGPHLDDQTIRGLAVCVYTWLSLNNFECELQGDAVIVKFDDGNFVLRVAGTHRTHPTYPDVQFADDYDIEVFNLSSFLKFYDENF